jgi:hypothetical protein
MSNALSNLSVGGAAAEAPAAAAIPATTLPAPTVAAPGDVRIIDEKTAEIRDAQGRMIKVERLSAVKKMRLARFCGAENDRFVGYATLASSVIAFEGQPRGAPISILEIEALVTRLDNDGLEAIGKALVAITPGMGVDQEVVENL